MKLESQVKKSDDFECYLLFFVERKINIVENVSNIDNGYFYF